jgi:hypothetical protein
MLLLSFLEADAAYVDLVPGMLVVGVGVGLFYSSITTTAVTAVDGSQASLAGGIIYMAQIAGGSLGLGINTAIVVAAPTLAEGVSRAFLLDALLALAALIIALLFLGTPGRIREQIHVPARHRAHAP